MLSVPLAPPANPQSPVRVARLLRERGLAAEVLTTRFVGEAPPDDAASDDDAGEGEGDDADAPVTAEAASSRTTTTTPRAASG